MKSFLSTLRYIKPYYKYAILNVIFNLFSILFSLVSLTMVIPFLGLLFGTSELVYAAPPLSLSPRVLIDNFNFLLSKVIIDHGKPQALFFICGMVVILFFLKNIFRYLGMYFLAPVRNGVVKDIRMALYDKILSLSLSYFSEERKGNLISTMTNDVQEVEWSVMSSLEIIFREPIAVISFLLTMTIMSPQLTLFVFILLPVAALLIGRIGKSLKKISVKGQAKLGELLSMIEETIGGIRIIKAFTADSFVSERFALANKEYNKLMIRVYRKKDLSGPMSEFMGAVALALVMAYGGVMALQKDQSLDAAMFIAYIAVFSQVIPPAKAFATAYYNIKKGMVSAERINSILNAEEVIKDLPAAGDIHSFDRFIEYEDVSFAYRKGETGWALKNINLRIDKGKTVALVGQSGSGKTSLANMLARFYDPTNGRISVDGNDIKQITVKSLRSLMGIVTQDSILFNDSVFSNIALGVPDAAEKDVIEAAKAANAHDFIMEMPEKYLTNVGDNGQKLSGGQKQRISIARAILKNPAILILDEATSALDTESEKLVQEALSRLMKNRTSIIIAHRLSTIQYADEIIVLHKGEIVEQGTHAMLLQKNGVYKKLYDLQAFT